MAISKEKKVEILAKLDHLLAGANSAVFVNFKALSVANTEELRGILREQGIDYFVAKKTLINLALDKQALPGSKPELPGEIALVVGEDSLAPAREIYQFSLKHQDKIKIAGGIFEGNYLPAEQMLEIAQIPSREVLYGRLVGLLNWPLNSLALSLQQLAEQKNN